jgi:hypothetical protein
MADKLIFKQVDRLQMHIIFVVTGQLVSSADLVIRVPLHTAYTCCILFKASNSPFLSIMDAIDLGLSNPNAQDNANPPENNPLPPPNQDGQRGRVNGLHGRSMCGRGHGSRNRGGAQPPARMVPRMQGERDQQGWLIIVNRDGIETPAPAWSHHKPESYNAQQLELFGPKV